MDNRKWPDGLGTILLALPIAISFALSPLASAQNYPPPPAGMQAEAAFAQEDLDRMLAPIALYPDALLSQILMAATYPLEVVEAARWSRANPGLQGDQAVRAVEQRAWDPSVKSLAAFPQILAMMDEKIDWTERLGSAFLAQQPQVMDSVQNLRQRAYAAGTLRSDNQIRVESQGPAIMIVPANPEIVYVPYYDPTVVYGNWWWPAPPVYWAPWGGYHPPYPGFFLSWGTGIPVISGFFFGGFDWWGHRAHVVNVHPYYYSRTVVTTRRTDARNRVVVRNVNAAPGVWQHDPAHRRGAPYRDASARQRYGTERAQINPRAVPPQTRVTDERRSNVRSAPPPAQPRTEQHNVRPVPRPVPQPRTEAPRAHSPQPAAASRPADHGRESRPAGSMRRYENNGERRGGGRDRAERN
jgi:hypothetical protein